MIKTKKVFALVKELIEESDEEIIDKIHIINQSNEIDSEVYKVYHADGYCLILKREVFDADMVAEFGKEGTVEEDGETVYYGYSDDAFDGFKRLPINKCIELLKDYVKNNKQNYEVIYFDVVQNGIETTSKPIDNYMVFDSFSKAKNKLIDILNVQKNEIRLRTIEVRKMTKSNF